MNETISDLEERVARLERDVATLRSGAVMPQSPARRARPVAPSDKAPRTAPAVVPPRRTLTEEEVLGRWFPRIGVLALILGAGFGFKYAIDQGWVGPGLRVVIGLLVGCALLAGGEAARRREWGPYAQAISGGGIAMLYLTVWSAQSLYGFLSTDQAFVSLLLVSAAGVTLAHRHGAESLAAISVIGGFMNPFVTGAIDEIPVGLFFYALAIDAGVVALSVSRDWRFTEKVAFTGSWAIFAAGEGSLGITLTAATILFLTFGALPYLRVFVKRTSVGWSDFSLVVVNGLFYYSAVMWRLTELPFEAPTGLEVYQGPFTLVMAAVYLGGSLVLIGRDETRSLRTLTSGMFLFFVVVWAPVEFGSSAPVVWSMQALAAGFLALAVKGRDLRNAGWVLLAVAVAGQMQAIGDDPVAGVREHYGRIGLALCAVTSYVISYLYREEEASSFPRRAGLVTANALTVMWISLEVRAAFVTQPFFDQADLHFALSGIWAVYAGVLLTVGFAVHSPFVRTMSVALLGITLAKMALNDLWLLGELQRLIGFVGIGVILLMGSLTYHRTRSLLTGERGES